MKHNIQSQCTLFAEEILKRNKSGLPMKEIVKRVNALQIKRNHPHPFSRRDIYNAVHNNCKEDPRGNPGTSLFRCAGEAVRGQHGPTNTMIYYLR